ncbi:unnamed protein product [marine sediment metagenome]|uniref:Uncharacterized protein n=1 Tax=marine sediment metagenome TaxID=412755 RepID=X1QQ67_9ZZZZ
MNRIKTIHIVTVCLTFLATVAMFNGFAELAGVAVGALAGWIGGNKNGQRSEA